MNIKNKILLAFALTIAVLSSAGIYYYSYFAKYSNDFYFDELEFETTLDIVPFVDLKSIAGERPVRKNTARAANNLSNTFDSHTSSGLIGDISPVTGSVSPSTKSRYAYNPSNKDNSPFLASNSTLLPAISFGSTGSKAASSTSDLSDTGYGVSSAKIEIPFSAPKAGNSGVYLVDPGAMPVEEWQRVPVGDGLWILLLLGVAYFFKPYLRNNYSGV